MTLEEFSKKVLRSLPSLTDSHDLEMMEKHTLPELFKKNFRVVDAIAYCNCCEEVNPDMDEDVALLRMKLLMDSYETKGSQS